MIVFSSIDYPLGLAGSEVKARWAKFDGCLLRARINRARPCRVNSNCLRRAQWHASGIKLAFDVNLLVSSKFTKVVSLLKKGGVAVAITRRQTQAERTHQSDRRMRDSAVGLIVERGTAATTLKEVGEQAGYSRGLAGYRFGSRDALFSFVVRSLGEDWLQRLTEVTARKVGYEALSAAIDEHFRFCTESPLYVRAFYILWFESVTPNSQLNSVISHIHQRRHSDVVGWIKADSNSGQIDEAAIASQFCASIIGIVYFWLANPAESEQLEQLHNELKKTMHLLLGQA